MRKRALIRCMEGEWKQEDNMPDKAEDLFRRALRFHPENTLALIRLGSVRAEKGSLDEAIVYF